MLKVLAVDDERIVRVALGTIIRWEEHGFELTATASDGRSGLEAVARHRPDIVITDLIMPNMNGLEMIGALAESGYPGKIIVLSNYGEYEYVREAMKIGAVDYLLKVTLKPGELLDVLRKAADLVTAAKMKRAEDLHIRSELQEKQLLERNQLWKELLTEEASHLPELLAEAARSGVGTDWPKGRLFLLEIDQYAKALDNGKIRNLKLMHFSLMNIVKEALGGFARTELIVLGHGRFAVLVADRKPEPDEAAYRQLGSGLIRLIRLYLNLTVNVAVSGPTCGGIAAVREQFERCASACGDAFYTGAGNVFATGGEARDAGFRSGYPLWSKRLQQAMESHDDSALAAALDETLAKLREERCDPEEAKRLFELALTEAELALAEREKLAGVHDETSALPLLREAKEAALAADSFDRFAEAVRAAFAEAERALGGIRNRTCRKEVVQVIASLSKRLADKITLDELAAEARMDVSYLCRIFKQDTGKSIVHYFHEMKMSQAAKLLKQPDVRIKEVSAAVGIDDPFYFNRLFKKTWGASPSEYRKRHLAPGEE